MMRRVADSAVIQTQLVLNSHLNGAGRLFGGQLMEWIDIVATVVARRHAHCNPTTASVDNLQFKEAVHLNNTLIIEGKLTYVGRTSMEVRVDTFVESLSGARKLVNTAYVVMVALDENEHPMEVPELPAQVQQAAQVRVPRRQVQLELPAVRTLAARHPVRSISLRSVWREV